MIDFKNVCFRYENEDTIKIFRFISTKAILLLYLVPTVQERPQ